ncbi:MAG: AraC family transcriptional regulator [Paludibacter sp.]|nr:AraC family transcriptional regulator [Paludibacter sp.]
MINVASNIEFKYLIANESDKKYGVTINTVGFQTIHPNETYPIDEHPNDYQFNEMAGRILDEFQFVYITKGRGELVIESSGKLEIRQGQLIIIFPGQWHSYNPDKNIGWNEYFIGFNGGIIHKLVKNSFLSTRSQVINVGLNEELVTLFKRAIEVAFQDKIGAQQHLSGIVMHMIGLVLYESDNNRRDLLNHQHLITNAKIVMNENIYNYISPEEIANELEISYIKFRRLFKKTTGYAPAKYFQELRIVKAKQLLLETKCPVKEVAYKLNYASLECFATVFKKRTGYTPTQYRKFNR